MEAPQNADPLGQVLDIFSFLGDSLDILKEDTTTEIIETEPLDEVIDVFGQLGGTLDFLTGNVADMEEVYPIDALVEEFGQLEEHLNIFKESMTVDLNLKTDPFKEPIDAITSFDAFQSLAETVTENIKVVENIENLPVPNESIDDFQMMTDIVTENMKAFPSEASENIENGDDYTSPFAQVVKLFGNLWESMAGMTEVEESSDEIHPYLSTVYDANVYFLLFLVFAIAFMLVLSFLLCSYCKRKMWEKEQWREIMDTDSYLGSDCSGSWISIDSSTKVSPLMINPDKEKCEEVYWFRQDLDMSPSIMV